MVTTTRQRLTWRNWAENQECAPTAIESPASEKQLVEVVEKVAAQDQRVKVVGNGALVHGDRVDGPPPGEARPLPGADGSNGHVTVQAGMKLQRLNDELAKRGMAIPNLGDIDKQSISGAVSTSTHGTARDLEGIAQDVTGMRLIAAGGSIVECSPKVSPKIFKAARVGLGALGLISTVTLQVVPGFDLHAREVPMYVD